MLALASPALLVILLLIVLPVGWLAWQSIYHNGFTLENYRRIFSEAIYWRSFSLTFQISLLVTLLALLLGYPIAYVASVVPKGWSVLILALVILPFWTSVLVRAYAWLALLQRTGVINQFLQYLGIIDEPLAGAQHVRHCRGDRAYPAALHGAAALRHHAEDSARSDAGGRQPRRQPFAYFLADLPAAVAARRARGHDIGVRAVSRLLHHARTARRRPHRDGFDAGQPQCRTL
jgi:hypothetical protein